MIVLCVFIAVQITYTVVKTNELRDMFAKPRNKEIFSYKIIILGSKKYLPHTNKLRNSAIALLRIFVPNFDSKV